MSTTNGAATTRKYVLIPGWIISKNDYQKHWISEDKLVNLYKVNPADCVVVLTGEIARKKFPNLIRLEPRVDGNYSLPTQ